MSNKKSAKGNRLKFLAESGLDVNNDEDKPASCGSFHTRRHGTTFGGDEADILSIETFFDKST